MASESIGTEIQSYLSCGYVSEESLVEIDKLSEFELKTIAAMALTHRDSRYSDRQRDLDRGIVKLLGKDPYWWNPT